MLRIMVIHLISSTQHNIIFSCRWMVVFKWHRKLASTFAVIVLWGCKEIWKCHTWHCWTLSYAAHDWDQGRSQLLRLRSSEGCHGLLNLMLVPRTLQSNLRPASLFHSTPFGLRIVCELALCPEHYVQVWLLVTTCLTPTVWFVEMPSATWGMLAFPVTCKNDCAFCSLSRCYPSDWELYRASWSAWIGHTILLQPAP